MLNRNEVIEILKEFDFESADYYCIEHDEILIDAITEKINGKIGGENKMKKVGLNYWKEKAEKLQEELNETEIPELKKQIAFLKNRNNGFEKMEVTELKCENESLRKEYFYYKELSEKQSDEIFPLLEEIEKLKKDIDFLKSRNSNVIEKLMKKTAEFDFYKEATSENNILIGQKNAILEKKNLLINQMDYCINKLIESLKGV